MANYIVTLRDRRRFDVKNSDDPVVEGTFLTFRAAATPADFVMSAIIDNKDVVQEVGGDRPMVA